MADSTRPGDQIRKRRQEMHLSQEELGKLVGASASSVIKWEQGTHFPRRHQGAIEKILGISLGSAPPAPTDDAVIEALENEAAALLEAARRMRVARGRAAPRKDAGDDDAGRRRHAG